ncbi:MAG: alpha/beta hydrolase [Acidimicrobiales bacterium]
MPLTEHDAVHLFRGEPDGFLDVGAGEAAYRTVGSGPDVIFVHGWPVSGATWRRLLPHLVDHVTCHVIDLPSAGSSRFDRNTPMSIQQHITSVQRVADLLGLDTFAVVAHDSGGLIARHALAGDARLRSMGLINTEPPNPSWRFRSFIAARRLPGLNAGLGWVAGQPNVRANKFVFGDAFVDRTLLGGEFAEFFFDPLHNNPVACDAAVRLLRSFDMTHVTDLPAVHAQLDVPVKLVWGDRDPFFPVERARAMVASFPNASIDVLEGVGLFAHEESPAAVAAALLPTLTEA